MLIMIMISLIILVLAIIMNLPLILPVIYTLGYYITGKRSIERKRDINEEKASFIPKISIQIPVKNERVDYIIRNIQSILSSNYPKDKLEIIIVSDDDHEGYINLVDSLEEKLSRSDLSLIRVVWRNRPQGGKAGALNDSLSLCSGDYIMVLDVDSVLEKDYFRKILQQVTDKGSVALGSWAAINTCESPFSEALALAQEFLFTTYYKYRHALSLPVMLAGSGCILDKSVFKNVGLWDTKIILEDVEYGLRLMLNGYKVIYVDDARLYLDVPANYRAFLIQQSKWAYGSIQLLKKYFKRIIKNNRIPLIKRIEVLVYIAQYISSLALIALSLLLPVLLMLSSGIVVPALGIFYTILFTSMIAYATLYLKHGLKRRLGIIRLFRLMGRASSLATFTAPRLALSSIKALLNLSIPRIPTPKGTRAHKYSIGDLKVEILWFIMLLLLFIMVFIKYGTLYYVLWHGMLISGHIYMFRMMILRKA